MSVKVAKQMMTSANVRDVGRIGDACSFQLSADAGLSLKP